MYDLSRFHAAQESDYPVALEEITAGRKESHWIWYVFPQLAELGYSYNARFYGIKDISEAKAYADDRILRKRLVEISTALLECGKNDPEEILGAIDAVKVRSCMTLFEIACPEEPVFKQVLDRMYSGRRDEKTLELLQITR